MLADNVDRLLRCVLLDDGEAQQRLQVVRAAAELYCTVLDAQLPSSADGSAAARSYRRHINDVLQALACHRTPLPSLPDEVAARLDHLLSTSRLSGALDRLASSARERVRAGTQRLREVWDA